MTYRIFFERCAAEGSGKSADGRKICPYSSFSGIPETEIPIIYIIILSKAVGHCGEDSVFFCEQFTMPEKSCGDTQRKMMSNV